MSTAGMGVMMNSGVATDPTAMLNNQLASALSTMGDAQFWEETISPSTIRTSLQNSDPSNPNSTPTLQRGMKWLLASISKGRDVSDFYPHVVKLVGASSLEVRKMVYMYLVQYADHDPTTRELSLLSINSFQRGLADAEQLIRALALRVLSSIRIPDILQIQILGVQKCAKDKSPYVRKCAANALAKLSPRCDAMQREMLLDIMRSLLDEDNCTMVLTSVLMVFAELCPERLEWLHHSFRKTCHLLTDMDEWGQVVVIETMARYCRRFFKEPKAWKAGTAERIDRQRRVRRTVGGIVAQNEAAEADIVPLESLSLSHQGMGGGGVGASSSLLGPPTSYSDNVIKPKTGGHQKVKRRVVVKGFYSDEEDDSTEEEVYAESGLGPSLSASSALRQRDVMGIGGGGGGGSALPAEAVNMNADEDGELDKDHKLLLDSSRPLLKSRNAGVVLAVCSLHYYCGVSSVKARSAIGKALVRIHRDRREIQYVVLSCIRTLVTECPSAFAPFLQDFFVKAMDPPFTRIIKIDILTSLALEPASIEAVLKELRTYIRDSDKLFVCATLRAVGKVAELARIVYDRHGLKSGDMVKARKTANRIALDCLYGLCVLTQSCDRPGIVGECVCVMQSTMLLLRANAGEPGGLMNVEDPNDVQGFALRRILLLLVKSLSAQIQRLKDADDEEASDAEEDNAAEQSLGKLSLSLPPRAVASALWMIGEWMSMGTPPPNTLRNLDDVTKSKMRIEIARLLDQAFPDLNPLEKEQAIHFASKLHLSSATGAAPASTAENAVCEHILSMGRVDVNPDVRDRARFESSILHAAVGMKHDTDALETVLPLGREFTLESAKKVLFTSKPAPSYLPVDGDSATDNNNTFRFGTLSSLVGHKARGAYLPLPPWGEQDSPTALRDPAGASTDQASTEWKDGEPQNSSSGFYADEEGSNSSDDEDGSSSDSSSSSESSEDNSDESSDDSSSDDSSGVNLRGPVAVAKTGVLSVVNGGGQNNLLYMNPGQPMTFPPPVPQLQPQISVSSQPSSDDEFSDGSDDSSSSSTSSDDSPISDSERDSRIPSSGEGNLLSMMGGDGGATSNSFAPLSEATNGSTSAMDDLRGLVMAPIVVDEADASDPNIDNDSSSWMQLVRPEHCGGLSVKARYLRGPTKIREAQFKGLDPASAALICLQVQLGNKKTDSGSIRRIKILPRSNPSGSIAAKIHCPQEIAELKPGQVSSATVCIEFASSSNRDGDLIARLDIKSAAGGGVPVQIKPSIGEILQPAPKKLRKASDFDSEIGKMQGFQRVQSTFALTGNTTSYSALPVCIAKHAAFTPVPKLSWKDGKLRLAGCLPASNDLVYVLIQCDKSTGAGTITVCCDHAVAVNTILNLIKKAISTPPPEEA